MNERSDSYEYANRDGSQYTVPSCNDSNYHSSPSQISRISLATSTPQHTTLPSIADGFDSIMNRQSPPPRSYQYQPSFPPQECTRLSTVAPTLSYGYSPPCGKDSPPQSLFSIAPLQQSFGGSFPPSETLPRSSPSPPDGNMAPLSSGDGRDFGRCDEVTVLSLASSAGNGSTKTASAATSALPSSSPPGPVPEAELEDLNTKFPRKTHQLISLVDAIMLGPIPRSVSTVEAVRALWNSDAWKALQGDAQGVYSRASGHHGRKQLQGFLRLFNEIRFDTSKRNKSIGYLTHKVGRWKEMQDKDKVNPRPARPVHTLGRPAYRSQWKIQRSASSAPSGSMMMSHSGRGPNRPFGTMSTGSSRGRKDLTDGVPFTKSVLEMDYLERQTAFESRRTAIHRLEEILHGPLPDNVKDDEKVLELWLEAISYRNKVPELFRYGNQSTTRQKLHNFCDSFEGLATAPLGPSRKKTDSKAGAGGKGKRGTYRKGLVAKMQNILSVWHDQDEAERRMQGVTEGQLVKEAGGRRLSDDADDDSRKKARSH